MYNTDPGSAWSLIAARLPYLTPMILVEIAGILLAIVLARRAVGPALCVILALGAMLLVGVASLVARQTLMAGVNRGERAFEDIYPLMIAIDIVHVMTDTAALVLLITAALAWRRRQPQPTPALSRGDT